MAVAVGKQKFDVVKCFPKFPAYAGKISRLDVFALASTLGSVASSAHRVVDKTIDDAWSYLRGRYGATSLFAGVSSTKQRGSDFVPFLFV